MNEYTFLLNDDYAFNVIELYYFTSEHNVWKNSNKKYNATKTNKA